MFYKESENHIKTTDIKDIDKNNCFLHYTAQKNIYSIFDVGLKPRIGKNSMAIEKSKKIFFTMGFDNTLILMDAWIKWLVLRPRSNFVYSCGAFFMTKKYFPKIIIDTIFKNWIKSDKRIKYACKKLNKILNNSVFLLLDLEENVDFKYNDIDEVKNQNFSRKQLKYIYTYCDNIEDITIEKWNMHTLSNKTIEKNKITLLSIDSSFKASELIEYMYKQSNIEFSKQLPFLNKYIDDYILKR